MRESLQKQDRPLVVSRRGVDAGCGRSDTGIPSLYCDDDLGLGRPAEARPAAAPGGGGGGGGSEGPAAAAAAAAAEPAVSDASC